jgi:ribulose-5-phosphate 4-epimerase/fuculose-1-phosphate aldolase
MNEDETGLRAQLVGLARRSHADGLVSGTAGNLSGRIGDGFIVTPSAVAYEAMTPETLVAIDAEGMPEPDAGEPSTDTPIHAAIYRARTDVGAVVHTHSPYASAFSTLGKELPALLLEPSGYLGGAIRTIDYVSPSDPTLARRLADGLATDRAVLLPNHGVYAVGESPEAAYRAAVAVEAVARATFIARSMGRPRSIPDDDVRWMHAFIHGRYGRRQGDDAAG